MPTPKKCPFSDGNQREFYESQNKKPSEMVQNVRIYSIFLTTFILLRIKDRNISIWRISSAFKTEKIPFYLKLATFLFVNLSK